MKPRRAVTYGLYGVAAVLVAIAAAAMPHLRPKAPLPHPPVAPPPPPITHVDPPPPPPSANQRPPQIDLVFALDTTSSMSGLIEGAKRKIWSIVNYVSSAQPQPRVRVGLIAYRDVGDAYVTRFFDLSDDMDAVFRHLRQLRAEGGGDTPEHVAKALSEAVNRPSWSQGNQVVKLVYLVGDAPGHTDYEDGYNHTAIARKAAASGIHVNTIRCGDDPEAGRYFRRIAELGRGQYSSVEEDGGIAEEHTPYDDKLAMLNRRLVGTAIGYGRGAGAVEEKVREAAAASGAVAADRAAFAARNRFAVSGDGDLVAEAGSKGASVVNQVAPSALPAPLAAMAPAEREAFVARKQAERAEVMKEIARVSSEREAFLKKAEAARPRRADGFDDRVKKALRDETGGVLFF